jgi:hypothetical protein
VSLVDEMGSALSDCHWYRAVIVLVENCGDVLVESSMRKTIQMIKSHLDKDRKTFDHNTGSLWLYLIVQYFV